MGSFPEYTLAENIAGFVSWAFGGLVLLGVFRALSNAS